MSDAKSAAIEAAAKALDDLYTCVSFYDEDERRSISSRSGVLEDPEEVASKAIEAAAPILREALIKEMISKWPTMTRDMVSRGYVKEWLMSFIEEKKDGAN